MSQLAVFEKRDSGTSTASSDQEQERLIRLCHDVLRPTSIAESPRIDKKSDKAGTRQLGPTSDKRMHTNALRPAQVGGADRLLISGSWN